MTAEPIARYEKWLIGNGASEADCRAIREEARVLIERAVAESLAAPFPERNTAWNDVQDIGGPRWNG
jgi:TPP-dependent pyruvate/acetoin dehydrogenase alpha subunit